MKILDHVVGRGIDLSLHSVWIFDDRAVFPIWNLVGQIVGYQAYNPQGTKNKNNNPIDGKYFTRIPKDTIGVWGLESWKLSNTLIITEGVFDAAQFTKRGMSAIAILSFDVNSDTRKWLKFIRSFRPVIAVCDGDASGIKLSKHAHNFIQLPSGEDASSVDGSIIEDIIEKA